MKKVLPVNLEIKGIGNCWEVIRLAAITAHENYLPWYYEKYLSLRCFHNGYVTYTHHEASSHISYFDEVMDFKAITGYDKSNIISVIKEVIDNNGYVLYSWDRYWVNGGGYYQKDHYVHDALLAGYDDDEGVFYIVDVNLNGIDWGVHKYKYEDFKTAFYSALQILRERLYKDIADRKEKYTDELVERNMPLTSFYLKEYSGKINLIRAYYDLKNFLYGYELIDKSKQLAGEPFITKRYGSTIYRFYYEDLTPEYLKDNPRIANHVKRILNNKNILTSLLNHLSEKGIISVEPVLFDNLKQLMKEINYASILFAKYLATGNTESFNSAVENLRSAEKRDLEILENVCELIFKAVRLMTFFPADMDQDL